MRTTWPHSHRRGLHPAKRTEPRAAIILPRFARNASASAKTCYAPCSRTAQHRSARFHPKLICCEKPHFFILSWVARRSMVGRPLRASLRRAQTDRPSFVISSSEASDLNTRNDAFIKLYSYLKQFHQPL